MSEAAANTQPGGADPCKQTLRQRLVQRLRLALGLPSTWRRHPLNPMRFLFFLIRCLLALLVVLYVALLGDEYQARQRTQRQRQAQPKWSGLP